MNEDFINRMFTKIPSFRFLNPKAERIAVLKAKIKAREGIVGYKDNVIKMKAELAELEA